MYSQYPTYSLSRKTYTQNKKEAVKTISYQTYKLGYGILLLAKDPCVPMLCNNVCLARYT